MCDACEAMAGTDWELHRKVERLCERLGHTWISIKPNKYQIKPITGRRCDTCGKIEEK